MKAFGKLIMQIDIIMGVYNAASTLEDCLNSVLRQEFANWRLLAVDDASTDDSLDILRRYAQVDERINVVTHDENQGLGAALNTAIAASCSPILCRMDADDIMHPNRLGVQLDFLTTHDLSACGCQTRYFCDNEQGRTYLTNRLLPCQHGQIHQVLLDGGHALCHPTLMVKRSMVSMIGGYRINGPGQDWDLFHRLCEAGHVANVPRVLHDMRISAGSVSFRSAYKAKVGLEFALFAARCRKLKMPEPCVDSFCASPMRYLGRLRYIRLLGEVRAERIYKKAIMAKKDGRWCQGYVYVFLAACFAPRKGLVAMRKILMTSGS